MIRNVYIRGFKRFGDVALRLPGHVVLAGPNNTGKTTVLQAIASWSLALRRWREASPSNPGAGFERVPMARQAFSAVPLGSFDLLWKDRSYRGRIEIEIRHSAGWSLAMELIADTTEQIFVRPVQRGASAALPRELDLQTVLIRPMTGLGTEEPLLQPPMIDQLLGVGRPGEVLRNLVVAAHRVESSWSPLRESIRKLFGYELLPPDASGPYIRSEYRMAEGGAALDIASAGTGFQQVLMLLALLHGRPGAVLLLDAPDEHLHLMLQDAIYHELRSAAARQRSQLIVATHSEVVINAVEPRELCVLLNEPRMVADTAERSQLIASLRVLSNADIMQAMHVRGVLYVEDFTDINILRSWAQVLEHRAEALLNKELMWKPLAFQAQEHRRGTKAGGRGILSREHFEALQLVRDGLPGLELRDGDAQPPAPDTEITGIGLQRLRWRRYEIAARMLPAEIHPEVAEKLDAICRAFGVEP